MTQLLLTKIDNSIVFKSCTKINKVKDIVQHIDQEKTYLFLIDVNSAEDIQLFSRIKNIPNLYFNTVNSIVIEDVIRADNVIYTQSSFGGCFNQEGS